MVVDSERRLEVHLTRPTCKWEELTINYGKIAGNCLRVSCYCLASTCRGWVWFLGEHGAVRPYNFVAAPGQEQEVEVIVIDHSDEEEGDREDGGQGSGQPKGSPMEEGSAEPSAAGEDDGSEGERGSDG
eukprot:2840370-Rhodomonas_salina.1